jgi:hypothetical protein
MEVEKAIRPAGFSDGGTIVAAYISPFWSKNQPWHLQVLSNIFMLTMRLKGYSMVSRGSKEHN